MRRILFMLMVGGALMAFAPATALAAHHHGKAHHHARHHARRHSRVKFERFGAASSSSSQTPSSTGTGQDNEQNAGTVASFQNGTLTITLNDGSTVSGKVSPGTEIECQAEDTTTNVQRDEHGRDNGDQGDDNGNDNGDDDAGEQEQEGQSCSSADLQPGAVVREAELKVSGSGATWDKVELMGSQTGTGDDDGADS